MLKISTKSQYGLRALVYLAISKEKINSLRTISKKEGISFDYLEKILSRLEKTGLVKARKGVLGGYFLAKHPKKIKISEILKVLEGDTFLVKCIGADKKFHCIRARKCLAKNLWRKIQDSINSTLNSITLADLIK
ncbi:MAG: Rrf2 family transcriptional regulator [bacterium]|nr:Rrf2 family transcriptional regulator [bacterium]